RMPTGYLPDEDQGSLLVMGQLPSGSTLEQTDAAMRRVQAHFRDHEQEAVEASTAVVGFGFAGRGQNQAIAFVKLRDWDLRDRPDLRVKALAARTAPVLAGM